MCKGTHIANGRTTAKTYVRGAARVVVQLAVESPDEGSDHSHIAGVRQAQLVVGQTRPALTESSKSSSYSAAVSWTHRSAGNSHAAFGGTLPPQGIATFLLERVAAAG